MPNDCVSFFTTVTEITKCIADELDNVFTGEEILVSELCIDKGRDGVVAIGTFCSGGVTLESSSRLLDWKPSDPGSLFAVIVLIVRVLV